MRFYFYTNFKMKKTVFILLIALVSIQNSLGQSLESMKTEAEKIYASMYESNLEGVLDYTYPKVFEIIEKDQMKQILKSTFEGTDEMKIRINKVEPNFKFGEVFTIGNQKFCFIDHDLSMTLIMKEKMDKDEAEMMIEIFKSGMKTDDVQYNKKEGSFTINKVSTMIAISDEYTKNEWKFINKDEKNVLAKKLFSDEVIKELGL